MADLQIWRIFVGNTQILQSFTATASPCAALSFLEQIWSTPGHPAGPPVLKPTAESHCPLLCTHTIAPAYFISHTKGQKLASRLPASSDTQCTQKNSSKELLAIISCNLRLFIFKTFAANLPVWLSPSCWISPSEHSNLLEIKSNQLFDCLGFKYCSGFLGFLALNPSGSL